MDPLYAHSFYFSQCSVKVSWGNPFMFWAMLLKINRNLGPAEGSNQCKETKSPNRQLALELPPADALHLPLKYPKRQRQGTGLALAYRWAQQKQVNTCCSFPWLHRGVKLSKLKSCKDQVEKMSQTVGWRPLVLILWNICRNYHL